MLSVLPRTVNSGGGIDLGVSVVSDLGECTNNFRSTLAPKLPATNVGLKQNAADSEMCFYKWRGLILGVLIPDPSEVKNPVSAILQLAGSRGNKNKSPMMTGCTPPEVTASVRQRSTYVQVHEHFSFLSFLSVTRCPDYLRGF